ncbi:MAG: nucleotidyl transferase AbiEii/AbiGii toxin family protein [Bacteroidales bacterium]|nr:nucleotidyl transferase AbiEii/AbiGii toxin family protein [Bacteroidales bacterium]
METVVAEKFQTMVDRAESNSRMKDFFDVYGLLSKERVDKVLLGEAIREVFTN